MKSMTSVVVLLAIASAATISFGWSCADGNLLPNPAFEGDGLGGLSDWSVQSAVTTHVIPKKGVGPGGVDAFRIEMPKADRLTQGGLTLVEGECYEAIAWVRTRDLTTGVNFLYFNSGWWKDGRSPAFPTDTQGKWQRLTWCFTACESKGRYAFAIEGVVPDTAILEVSGLELKAMSEKGRTGSKPPERMTKLTTRVIPIDPLLAEVDVDDAMITFYYAGDLEGDLGDYEIAASVDWGNHWRTAKMDMRRRARVSFGKIQLTDSYIYLSVGVRKRGSSEFVCRNEYRSLLNPKPPKGPQGRRLNNFVTELLRVKDPGGQVRFFNPRKGWVYIGFTTPAPDAFAFFEGSFVPVIRPRPGERSETMRFLPAGWHTLTLKQVPAGAELAVRAVKRIVHVEPSLDTRRTDLLEWKWRGDFSRRYAWPFFNTPSGYYSIRGDLDGCGTSMAFWEERGCQWESMIGFTAGDKDRLDSEKCRRRVFDNGSWRQGMTITVDENGIECTSKPSRINYAEAVWEAVSKRNAVNTFYADAAQALFTDPATQTSEIAATVNSGRGLGMLYPEVYCAARKDAVAAHEWEDHFIRWYQSVTNLVPAASRNIVYYFGTFVEPGDWTDWACPEGDMKVLYADLIRRIATDPAYGDPGGIAAGYFGFVDDDVVRWLCKVVRYYAVEGGTEDLSEKFGFKYLPGLVKNADFDEGFAHWKPQPGAPGCLEPFERKHYGRKIQGRTKVPFFTGDHIALFTRTNVPNRLSQRLTGLEPGKLYRVHFVAADEEDVDHPGTVTNGTFMARATVTDGGEEIPEMTGLHIPIKRWGNPKIRLFNQYAVVFRAKATSATLTISDWASDRNPGAELGRRTYVNFVNARPYYVEDEAELNWLRTRRVKRSSPLRE